MLEDGRSSEDDPSSELDELKTCTLRFRSFEVVEDESSVDDPPLSDVPVAELKEFDWFSSCEDEDCSSIDDSPGCELLNVDSPEESDPAEFFLFELVLRTLVTQSKNSGESSGVGRERKSTTHSSSRSVIEPI